MTSNSAWVTISGQFSQFSYTSITSYDITGRVVFHEFDSAFKNTTNRNPYVPNNPSVMAYAQPPYVNFDGNLSSLLAEIAPFLPTAVGSIGSHVDVNLNSKLKPLKVGRHGVKDLMIEASHPLAHPMLQRSDAKFPIPDVSSIPEASIGTGNLPFYRLTVEQSWVYPDGSGVGCTNSYLFAYPKFQDEVIIMRMKVPTTFFNSSSPSTTFGSYMAHYFSISSQRNYSSANVTYNKNSAPLYWGVNGRMLSNYSDSEGYAYVFMTPVNFTWALAKEQNLPRNSTTPPIYTWGGYTGRTCVELTHCIALL